MKKILYWCKLCGRYRCTDGEYVQLNTHEKIIMNLHISELELVEKTCPDCSDWRHW